MIWTRRPNKVEQLLGRRMIKLLVQTIQLWTGEQGMYADIDIDVWMSRCRPSQRDKPLISIYAALLGMTICSPIGKATEACIRYKFLAVEYVHTEERGYIKMYDVHLNGHRSYVRWRRDV